ncbi:MAG: acyl-CoA thioesterase [Eubacteriales bacterium]|nr:acyl-CoA thioesterase [Eubacteriales bacterium]
MEEAYRRELEINEEKLRQGLRKGKRVRDSRAEQVHLIMKQHINASGRLFGGILMQWIDEVASVVAMRHAGTKQITTVCVDQLLFKKPTFEGDLLVSIGYVTYVGKTSMEVEVDTYVEGNDGMRRAVNRAFLVMVALDDKDKPCEIPLLILDAEEERGRHEAAWQRYRLRKQRSRQGI